MTIKKLKRMKPKKKKSLIFSTLLFVEFSILAILSFKFHQNGYKISVFLSNSKTILFSNDGFQDIDASAFMSGFAVFIVILVIITSFIMRSYMIRGDEDSKDDAKKEVLVDKLAESDGVVKEKDLEGVKTPNFLISKVALIKQQKETQRIEKELASQRAKLEMEKMQKKKEDALKKEKEVNSIISGIEPSNNTQKEVVKEERVDENKVNVISEPVLDNKTSTKESESPVEEVAEVVSEAENRSLSNDEAVNVESEKVVSESPLDNKTEGNNVETTLNKTDENKSVDEKPVIIESSEIVDFLASKFVLPEDVEEGGYVNEELFDMDSPEYAFGDEDESVYDQDGFQDFYRPKDLEVTEVESSSDKEKSKEKSKEKGSLNEDMLRGIIREEFSGLLDQTTKETIADRQEYSEILRHLFVLNKEIKALKESQTAAIDPVMVESELNSKLAMKKEMEAQGQLLLMGIDEKEKQAVSERFSKHALVH